MTLRFPSPVYKGMRIGLLGGSFNPAHEGHRHISLIALRRLQLHQVWWLVSPQNPLKSSQGMGSFEDRLSTAKTIASHAKIHVSDLEQQLATSYTSETLAHLSKRLPRANLVWLMGADNLIDIHRWKEWTKIFETSAVAVIARPGYAQAVLKSQAARRYASARLDASDASLLAERTPPAWVYVQEDLHPASATAIRKGEVR